MPASCCSCSEPGCLTVTQAASTAAAVAGSLLSPEALQALLAGHGTAAAAQGDSGANGGGPLGHTSGAGTMQELLLSLRAAAAAGGGDVQRMFGAFALPSCPLLSSQHPPRAPVFHRAGQSTPLIRQPPASQFNSTRFLAAGAVQHACGCKQSARCRHWLGCCGVQVDAAAC